MSLNGIADVVEPKGAEGEEIVLAATFLEESLCVIGELLRLFQHAKSSFDLTHRVEANHHSEILAPVRLRLVQRTSPSKEGVLQMAFEM
jgi:hypothetical protein